MPTGVGTSFSSAFQASISVLLTIFYGVIAAQLNLLSPKAGKDISKTCIRMLMPALLIADVGSQIRLGTAMRYVPILIWSVVYNVVSIAFGSSLTKMFGLPGWVTPAIAFNNTTSLPLLLIQSLQVTGLFDSLDPSPDVIERARSYFLVNSMISNSLTFALGPNLLNGQEDDPPSNSASEASSDVENGSSEDVTEDTSLLPDSVVREQHKVARRQRKLQHHLIARLPLWAQSTIHFLYQFYNAPFIGTVIGIVIGVTPALHRLFFASPDKGGYFNAWLTTSIKNLGNLFPPLQIIVVGVKLSQALIKMKRGEKSGSVPWPIFFSVTFIRFVLWPLISIAVIWLLATKTGWLSPDPVLWFAMMLMPAGPPALKLMALAEVEAESEEEKLSVAKFLTLSYIVTPLICFSVVGSFKAAEAAGSN